MADRNFKRVVSLNNVGVVIAGKFTTGSDGIVDSYDGAGVESVTGDTGEYTITLDDGYTSCESAQASFTKVSTADAGYLQWKYHGPSSGVFVLFTKDNAGSAADLVSAQVDFLLYLSNSSVV